MDRQSFIFASSKTIAASGSLLVYVDTKAMSGKELACVFKQVYAATGDPTGSNLFVKNVIGTSEPGDYTVPNTSDTVSQITLTSPTVSGGGQTIGDMFVLEVNKFSEVFAMSIVNTDTANAVVIDFVGYC